MNAGVVPEAHGRVLWAVSLALVLAAHGAVGWFVAHHAIPETAGAPPAPVVMMELSPEPAPPPPVPVVPEEPPPPPPPVAELPPAPRAEVPLPPKPPPPKPVVRRDLPPRPPEGVSPPAVSEPAAASPVAAAPPAPSNAVPTWQALLSARLQQAKRYPSEARFNHQQGVVHVRVGVGRDGGVRSAAIQKTSGYAALDEETLALMQRVSPLPPPPAEVPGDPVVLVIPVVFSLR